MCNIQPFSQQMDTNKLLSYFSDISIFKIGMQAVQFYSCSKWFKKALLRNLHTKQHVKSYMYCLFIIFWQQFWPVFGIDKSVQEMFTFCFKCVQELDDRTPLLNKHTNPWNWICYIQVPIESCHWLMRDLKEHQ